GPTAGFATLLARVMAFPVRLRSKLRVSGPVLAAASAIACRRLPRPLSRVFETVNVAGVVRFSRASRLTGRRRAGHWRDTNSRLSQELAIDWNSFSPWKAPAPHGRDRAHDDRARRRAARFP